MLINNKTYKENDVVSFKISSGEEIIGRFLREDNDTVTITKPSVLMMNQQGMGMVPFMFTVNPDSEYQIYKSTVIVQALTDEGIAKEYLAKTSGIALR